MIAAFATTALALVVGYGVFSQKKKIFCFLKCTRLLMVLLDFTMPALYLTDYRRICS
jgi:hypothetical protein